MKYASTMDRNGVETVVVVLPLSQVPLFDPDNPPQANTYGVDDDVEVGWINDGSGQFVAPPPDLVAIEAKRVASLWQAAHDYEYAQISGSAIGLLAMGVMSGKPKCTAVQNWIKSIWTEYYTRKANGSTNYDYSFAGAIPYTVPEIMEEMGL